MTPEQVRHARALPTHPDATIASIARRLGVSRSPIYRYGPEPTGDGGRQALRAAPDRPELQAAPGEAPTAAL